MATIADLNQRWIRTVTAGLAGAAIVTAVFVLTGGRVSQGAFLVPLIYAAAIAIGAAVVLPWVERCPVPRPATAHRCAAAASFAGVAVLGSLAASGVVIAADLVPAGWSHRRLLTSGLGISLLVGALLFAHEMGRERRARAERALREETQRRQEADRLATEARLTSLGSRLQPHFVLNALGTITQLATVDPSRTQQLLEQLTDLLSASLERAGRRTVPLREEIDAVWGFLDIEHAQLADQLRWRLQPMRDLTACQVPPFSLQSLVQNSVKHVAAARPEGAEIRVEGGLADGKLVLSVWDDGPGFELARAPAGRGLDTLRLQLAELYGDRAGLEVRREDAGTRVVMWLPGPDAAGSPA